MFAPSCSRICKVSEFPLITLCYLTSQWKSASILSNRKSPLTFLCHFRRLWKLESNPMIPLEDFGIVFVLESVLLTIYMKSLDFNRKNYQVMKELYTPGALHIYLMPIFFFYIACSTIKIITLLITSVISIITTCNVRNRRLGHWVGNNQ